MSRTAEEDDFSMNAFSLKTDDRASLGSLPDSQLRQESDTKPCSNQRADGIEFAAFACDAWLESGGTTSCDGSVVSAAFVEYKGLMGEF